MRVDKKREGAADGVGVGRTRVLDRDLLCLRMSVVGIT